MLNRLWNVKFWGAGVIVLVICTASLSVVADDGDWISIGSSDDGSTFHLRKGTAEFITLTDNAPAIAVVERYFDGKNKTSNFYKIYVRISDCTQGFGKLVFTEFDGTPITKADWVSGGGTQGSERAEILCTAAKKMATEQAKDSIKGSYVDKSVKAPSKK